MTNKSVVKCFSTRKSGCYSVICNWLQMILVLSVFCSQIQALAIQEIDQKVMYLQHTAAGLINSVSVLN